MFNLQNEQKRIKSKADELHEEFIEMGQIKTRFDTEKFTVGKEGNFIASQFHFLMRQYRFGVEETRRMLLEYEEAQREIDFLKKEQLRRDNNAEYSTSSPHTKLRLSEIEHLDIEIIKQESRLRSLEIDINGKLQVLSDFEDMRKALIEKNGGTSPSNKQFQEEQPAYYQWFISKQMMQQLVSRSTGLSEGIVDAHLMASRKPIIENSKMQILPLFRKDGALNIIDLNKNAFLTCDSLFEENQ